MAVIHSFYLPAPQWHAPFTLSDDEAHHLLRVLRIKPNQEVRLFDGQGRQGIFIVARVDKHSVYLTLESEEFIEAPSTRCTLAAGFSKAVRRGWFLEKAVELGAHSLWFWQGDFSQAKLPDMEKSGWQGSLVAGAKQCENPWLPDLRVVPGGVPALISEAKKFAKVLVLYEGETNGRLLCREDLNVPGDTLMVIGPEGGFSPEEVRQMREAELDMISLGKSILRWETAAVLALGMAWWARQ